MSPDLSQPRSDRAREIAWALLIAAAGLAPRLLFAARFPTNPVSDFAGLLKFAERLGVDWLAKGSVDWDFYNPGMPMLLSLGLRAGGASEATARLCTLLVLGFAPLLVFLLLRGVLSLRARLVASLLLALWPGLVIFSGVVAQDNWELLPTVALGALAVRPLLLKEGRSPIAAALLLAVGGYIRQEMLLVLFPLAVAAAGVGARRNLLKAGLVLAGSLSLIATQRQLATGRFALTTEHAGLSALGSYQPGAVLNDWAVPGPYLAAKLPDAARPDYAQLDATARRLVLDEALRRPAFHLARGLSSALRNLEQVGSGTLGWSISGAGVLPESRREEGKALAHLATGPLNILEALLHLAFFVALAIGLARRSRAILVLALAVVLKVLLHAALVSQPRYFVPIEALEMLAIAVAVDEASLLPWRSCFRLGLVAVIGGVLLHGAMAQARSWALRHDLDDRPTFLLTGPRGAELRCTVESGRLEIWSDQRAAFAFEAWPPAAGAVVRLSCLETQREDVPIALTIEDAFPGRALVEGIEERVLVGGKLVALNGDTRSDWRGWKTVGLEPAGPGGVPIVIELAATGQITSRIAARSAFQLVEQAP